MAVLAAWTLVLVVAFVPESERWFAQNSFATGYTGSKKSSPAATEAEEVSELAV